MSTFMLFGGVHCYPVGGWNDFIFAGALDECKARFASWDDCMVTAAYPEGIPLEWAHIVDVSTRQKILTAHWGEGHAVTWQPPTDDDR